jgi:hypothetical protein
MGDMMSGVLPRGCRGALIGLIALCGATMRAAPLPAQAPVLLGVPARANESVSVAAEGRFVAVVWGASTTGGTDVYSAVSRDGGVRFGAPVRVNAAAFDARVGGEQPPHVVLVPRRGAEPALVVVWTAKRPEGSRLLTARSDDGGASFGATSIVPGTDAAGNRGWESVAVDAGGRVHVLWLDHRRMAVATHQHGAPSPASATASTAKPDPVERASLSQLYVAPLDGSSAPQAITGGVCYCCKTSFIAGSDGTLHGVWRHVFPGDLRDIAFTTSRNRGRTFSAPVRVSEDHWEFDGCPDNGPALAVDGARRVHVVWPSPADVTNPSVMALFYALSPDARQFMPRVRIPTSGPAGHVQVLAEPRGSVLVAWDEMSRAGRSVMMARGTPDARGRIQFQAVGSPAAGRYPAVALTTAGAVIAWAQPKDGGSVIAVAQVPR